MSQVITFTQPRTLRIDQVEDAALQAQQVRVRTLYSGISAGTELSAYRGSNVYLHKRWDPGTRLFVPTDAPSQPYPLVGWGYEEVGEVVELGPDVAVLKTGDIVYGTWGHRSHAVLDGTYAAQRLKPAALDPLLAIFSHIGPIALNGILDAQLHIGENVVVFGLGVPGQIAAQLARQSGARVIGVDRLEKRLALAQTLGAIDVALNPDDGSLAERIKALSGGRGADVCLEISGFIPALQEATRAVAYAGRVVALGFYQTEAQGLFLGEEFHHNRVQIICSQISNVDPALTHRWDRLRLIQTIMDLQVRGTLNLRPLITHVVPFAEAAEAFRLLDETPQAALQVVLEFPRA
jgi:2-desacetyl-2-hydroxyethyl bacteriochlorophyllide A dehydrogenase